MQKLCKSGCFEENGAEVRPVSHAQRIAVDRVCFSALIVLAAIVTVASAMAAKTGQHTTFERLLPIAVAGDADIQNVLGLIFSMAMAFPKTLVRRTSGFIELPSWDMGSLSGIWHYFIPELWLECRHTGEKTVRPRYGGRRALDHRMPTGVKGRTSLGTDRRRAPTCTRRSVVAATDSVASHFIIIRPLLPWASAWRSPTRC